MNNKILLVIIFVLLAGSGVLAGNKDAIQRFCVNLVGEAVSLMDEHDMTGVPVP